jgi:hypothetical protein
MIFRSKKHFVPKQKLSDVGKQDLYRYQSWAEIWAIIGIRFFFFKFRLFQVSWVRHDDVSLISVGKLKYIKDDRFKIIHEDNNIEWVLAIRSLKKSDEG